MTRFFILDDDKAARRMLASIVEDHDLGKVVGEASDGLDVEGSILKTAPDILIIDLLMPRQDGIETIRRLRTTGLSCKYVMLSQVEHKNMISEAYEQGIEYYIQKPINRVEVVAVLRKVTERIMLERSLSQIRKSLEWLNPQPEPAQVRQPQRPAAELVRSYLTDLGVAGEVGSRDLIKMIGYLLASGLQLDEHHFPSLKELYMAILPAHLRHEQAEKEMKAIEQRIRRTVQQALLNLASLGLTDFANPIFEQYATKYFDFVDVRQKMRELESEETQSRVRLNLKKFIFALYLDVLQVSADRSFGPNGC